MNKSEKEFRYVFGVGAEVQINTSGTVGQVLEVCLKADGEQYRVAWWNGQTRNVEWFESCEVSAGNVGRRMAVGFCR